MTGEVPAWWADANCHPSNKPDHMTHAEWTGQFFPERGDGVAVRRAMSICHGCPVRDDCLHAALAGREPGVWGGTSGQQRRRLEQPPKARTWLKPCGTPAAYDRHRRNQETPCPACRAAYRERDRERKGRAS